MNDLFGFNFQFFTGKKGDVLELSLPYKAKKVTCNLRGSGLIENKDFMVSQTDTGITISLIQSPDRNWANSHIEGKYFVKLEDVRFV